MDIRQLHYFAEVAKYKNFTKASQALFVSQPSISKMIKSLEDELGVTLLDRSEREVELTDTGKLVNEKALIILQLLEELTSSVNELVQLKRGKVKMGILPTISALLFPKIIAGFKKSYPRIEIQMVEYSAKQVEMQMDQGNIDFGVTVLPVNTKLYGTVPLLSEELVVIVSNHHWLAGRKSVSLVELKNEPFILFTKEFALHDVVWQACSQAGFEPEAIHMTSLWDFCCEMVSSQLGISLIPRSMANRLHHLAVQTVSISHPQIAWELALIYPRDKYLSYASREFIAYIQANPPQISQDYEQRL
ncbi:LysR family transcriptional regulator [Paenibacillus aceris]|uniref:DNA-binding transcriptional LysR family regulator n=1 Tax=Paenibacillus aceris TaxID=869555 RepID=A0ABS4I413_9BACL|nr:LysR family transcriptional regulator [Paenibacillus aceris]MBP1965639.1 DNA-binding transcriptional LysR family regulator [Paenibacillus aceris]NHW36356.1 LysR family transcriptional regulator [Paenibacillus aceris]